jgi:hypothetical protein
MLETSNPEIRGSKRRRNITVSHGGDVAPDEGIRVKRRTNLAVPELELNSVQSQSVPDPLPASELDIFGCGG